MHNMKYHLLAYLKMAFILCLLLMNTKSFSQKVQIAIEIKDNTNNPLAFATLALLNENKQYVCNSNGKFVGIADEKDSFLISSVGFLDSILYVRKLLNNPIVILQRKISVMKEIIIKNGKKQSIGNLNLKEDRSIIGGDSSSPSFEIAKLIKTKGVYTEFKVLTVSFRQKHFYNSMSLKLHIYTVNNSGLPGDDLLIDSTYLVRSEMWHDGIITIDVRSANIILKNEDFFVGLQFLHPFDEKLLNKNKMGFVKDAGIIETKKEQEALTYRRSNHFKKCWHIEYTTGYIIPKQNQYDEINYLENPSKSNLKPINLIAGVEIEVFDPE